MTFACVEALCRTYGVPYNKEENSLSFTMCGRYEKLLFPILVSQAQRPGIMQALLWFPEPLTPSIEEVERLCAALNETFNPQVEVGFCQERGRFWVGSLFGEKDAEYKLGVLACACDILFPLIYRIGCLGRWSRELIQLACTDPQDCAGRA